MSFCKTCTSPAIRTSNQRNRFLSLEFEGAKFVILHLVQKRHNDISLVFSHNSIKFLGFIPDTLSTNFQCSVF